MSNAIIQPARPTSDTPYTNATPNRRQRERGRAEQHGAEADAYSNAAAPRRRRMSRVHLEPFGGNREYKEREPPGDDRCRLAAERLEQIAHQPGGGAGR